MNKITSFELIFGLLKNKTSFLYYANVILQFSLSRNYCYYLHFPHFWIMQCIILSFSQKLANKLQQIIRYYEYMVKFKKIYKINISFFFNESTFFYLLWVIKNIYGCWCQSIINMKCRRKNHCTRKYK